MRASLLSTLTISVCCQVALARLLYPGPEDIFAFPKYRVTFLNALPVLNDTAQRWLEDGLRGGEHEFLEEPWQDNAWYQAALLKEIDSGEATDAHEQPESVYSEPSGYRLEYMKMGPQNAYVCLIPPARDSPPPAPEDGAADATLGHSWSLLQPLAGRCLYEIRQFRELPPTHPISLGGHVPMEDPEWESFTLGRAPRAAQEPGADLTVAQQNALAANLELARGPGSHYLVQRWGDGTYCDKTGRPREVEVQFHCSMTSTDSISLVREAKTCSYVLIVHTPRLCGEPGFQSPLESREESFIRCREIVDSLAESTNLEQQLHGSLSTALGESDNPIHLPPREPLLSVPVQVKPQRDDSKAYDGLIKTMIEALTGNSDLQALTGENPQVFIQQVGENGEFIIEITEEIPLDDLAGAAGAAAGRQADNLQAIAHQAIAEALRDAGIEVKGEKINPETSRQSSSSDEENKEENDDGDEPDMWAKDEL